MVSETDGSSIKQVEKFIRRLHDRELVFKRPTVKNKELNKEFNRISQRLSETIRQYQIHKIGLFARFCLFWINRAYTMDFIQEGKSLFSKNEKLERDNNRLRERLDECNKRCQRLEEEIKRIHNRFPDTRTFAGDVQGE